MYSEKFIFPRPGRFQKDGRINTTPIKTIRAKSVHGSTENAPLSGSNGVWNEPPTGEFSVFPWTDRVRIASIRYMLILLSFLYQNRAENAMFPATKEMKKSVDWLARPMDSDSDYFISFKSIVKINSQSAFVN